MEIKIFEFEKLPYFDIAKNAQYELLQNTPVIIPVDTKSYKEAKENRRKLRENGRYKYKNEEKLIFKNVKSRLKDVSEMCNALIAITGQREADQDEKIKAYENKKQEEKEAKEKAEKERIEKQQYEINIYVANYTQIIKNSSLESIDNICKHIEVSQLLVEDLQDVFVKERIALFEGAKIKKAQLKEFENIRIENIRIEKEAKQLKRERDEFEVKKKIEQKKAEKEANTIANNRKTQLHSINVKKSLIDCKLFSETEYFEYFEQEKEKFEIAKKLEQEQKEKEQKEKDAAAEIKKKKQAEQAELMKTDFEKVAELITELTSIKNKYNFKSEVYKKMISTLEYRIDEIIKYIEGI